MVSEIPAEGLSVHVGIGDGDVMLMTRKVQRDGETYPAHGVSCPSQCPNHHHGLRSLLKVSVSEIDSDVQWIVDEPAGDEVERLSQSISQSPPRASRPVEKEVSK